MSSLECPRENDVVMAVASGRWPARCDAELKAHIESCAICRDVAVVAMAFDGAEPHGDVPVPSSAHMWWRLQMQARHDAARAAVRPLAVAQIAVAAAALVLGVAMAGMLWVFEAPALTGLVERLWSQDLQAGMLGSVAAPETLLALGVISAGLLVMPVAVYFALSE